MPSEHERMLAGEFYNSRDPELLAAAHRARALLAQYNGTPSTDGTARRSLLTRLLGAVGEGVWIEPPFFCDYGAQIVIGDNVWIGAGTLVMPGVTIGDDTTIGAASLVTNDVPSRVLAFGQPCRIQREI